MTLNFGNNLFPPRNEFLANFDYQDVLRGQSYIDFFCSAAIPETEAEQQAYDTNDDADLQITGGMGTNRACQTFTLTETTWISSIEIKGSDATASISLEQTTTGEPNGQTITGGSVSFPGLGSAVWTKWTLSAPVELAAGVYAIILNGRGPGGGTASEINWRVDSSSPTYTGGSVGTSANSGATWTMDTDKDAMFRINGFTEDPFLIFPEETETEYTESVFDFGSDVITTATQIGEVNFDLTIGKSAITDGTAVVEMSYSLEATSTNDVNMQGYVIVKLIIDREGTETVIGSSQSMPLKKSVTNPTTVTDRAILSMDLTRTTVKIGDILRLSVECWVDEWDDTAAGAPTVYSVFHVKHEPEGTDLKIKIPFKLDV